MKRAIGFVKDSLLGKRLEFRVRLFNVLAMAGIVISLISVIACSINGEGLPSIIASAVTTVIALALLIYAARTGRYQRCYIITIVAIFLVFFPLIFFVGGGYSGSMPYYFIFAVAFTVFMLEGAKALIVSCFELLCYIGLCLYAYYNPEVIKKLPTELAEFTDIILGFTVVSISLGLTMFLHFRLYNRQQRELESARESALAASEAKSRFLANMSHEIRTPIGVILGMNEVILRETESEQITAYGRSVESAGQQLLTLIDNILDLSAIERGELEITEERFETAGLIYALSVVGANLAGRRNLRFITEADEAIPRTLTGDMPHIRQIVSNFLSNAAKYTERGTITLSFSALPAQSADEITLRIAAADTGIGIKAENIPFLFDAFTRGETQGRYVEGSGLGLAIAKEYAERMGGRIHVQSEFGYGSVFTLELTQKVSDGTPLGDWERTGGAARSDSGGDSFTAPDCGILIVDDNGENLQLIKSLLARTLMQTDTAMNGAECLDMVGKRRYDVILMDYMMPGMDGEETLRRLKARPGFSTPVIALTANVMAGVREKLLDAGFCQYLSKPVMRRDLEAALLDALPKERVTIGTAVPMAQIPAEIKAGLARELSACGVVLEDGLRYADGDLGQYGRSAVIFIENYSAAADAIRALAEENDWAGMKFRVHSLKAVARNLGATALSETAAKLERLCVSGDSAYITAALPALHLECERAKDGLTVFVGKLDGLLPAPEKAAFPVPELDKLLQMLKFNQYQNAMGALAAVIDAGGASQRVEILREIRKKTDELQFREAERLLAALMESETNKNGN
ncbi:MAG: response regulator [Oscillospiraceae bacterium]|nr:response regulator [Oscillospiraceae bacterium]